jgi:hypothetical protein
MERDWQEGGEKSGVSTLVRFTKFNEWTNWGTTEHKCGRRGYI